VGAAAGAAVDDSEAALIGGLLGALVGSEVGSRMDEEDRRQTALALENNPVGQTSTWTDPDTGARYGVTPNETFSRDGSPCREFVIEREIAGEEYQSTETACRQADGSWRIIT
jgi:surface antigen